MSHWRTDPTRAADALIRSALADLSMQPNARVLLINQSGTLPQMLAADGINAIVWNRRLGPAHGAASQPPTGPFDLAILRLPKSKDECAMLAHQAAATLTTTGRLIIYGGNDEGIKTVPARLTELSSDIQTLSARGHGRVLLLTRPDRQPSGTLPAWRQTTTLSLPPGPPRPWISYPGLFAGGALDPGTALLLAHLPALKPGASILDYGCGTGPIARTLVDRDPTARIDLLDNDTLALLAASENVPNARTVLGSDLSAVAGNHYDLIVSNPPIHDGIREDHRLLQHLMSAASAHLKPKGHMMLVVQRRIPLDTHLAANFRHVSTPADDGRFRLWLVSN
jgi:16S rRNA (guanine1207-N2)-methyltransferase